jgi:hypothetical protein
MKRLLFLLFLVPGLLEAQTVTITGDGAATTVELTGPPGATGPTGPQGAPGSAYTHVAFSALGTPANGTSYYCTDCQVVDPCAGSGSGAFAFRVGSVWSCAGGGVADPGSNGFMVRTAADTSVARTLTSPLGTLAIGNSTGVAGNPTLDVDTSIFPMAFTGTSLPATCVVKDLFVKTDTEDLYYCLATDTWSLVLSNTAATDDTVPVGTGTTFALKAVPNCTDAGGNHLNYTASSNSFSCGTTGDGTGGGSAAFDSATYTDDEEFRMAAVPTDTTYQSTGWRRGNCAFYSQTATPVADHPGQVDIGSAASDNDPCIIYGQSLVTTTYTGSEWTFRAGFATVTDITDKLMAVGLQLGSVDSTSDAIRVKFDTDDGDSTWIFQICNTAAADGCDAAGDATNSKTVASTKAPSAGAWNEFRMRRVESGVGGNPTIYMQMCSAGTCETEKTFCTAGCDDTLTTLPSATLVPILEITARNTISKYFSVDFVSFRVTAGLARY